MLSLARYTGRREAAICNLMASDFVRTPRDIRAVLASLGMDERHADGWKHGAIHWRKAHDKQGLARVTPLGEKARAALDDYLRKNPRMDDGPLFPAPGRPRKKDDPASDGPEKPIRPDLAGKWLLRAEKLAKLPKLKGGRWHPYRRLWATERKHLPDKDVAAAGGWKDTRALKQSYEHADADTVFKVVEGDAECSMPSLFLSSLDSLWIQFSRRPKMRKPQKGCKPLRGLACLNGRCWTRTSDLLLVREAL